MSRRWGQSFLRVCGSPPQSMVSTQIFIEKVQFAQYASSHTWSHLPLFCSKLNETETMTVASHWYFCVFSTSFQTYSSHSSLQHAYWVKKSLMRVKIITQYIYESVNLQANAFSCLQASTSTLHTIIKWCSVIGDVHRCGIGCSLKVFIFSFLSCCRSRLCYISALRLTHVKKQEIISTSLFTSGSRTFIKT